MKDHKNCKVSSLGKKDTGGTIRRKGERGSSLWGEQVFFEMISYGKMNF